MGRKRKPVDHPIWRILAEEGRTLAWLARKTRYSESHVYGIKSGFWPAAAPFRRACAEKLGRPESELFIPDDRQCTSGTEQSGIRVSEEVDEEEDAKV